MSQFLYGACSWSIDFPPATHCALFLVAQLKDLRSNLDQMYSIETGYCSYPIYRYWIYDCKNTRYKHFADKKNIHTVQSAPNLMIRTTPKKWKKQLYIDELSMRGINVIPSSHVGITRQLYAANSAETYYEWNGTTSCEGSGVTNLVSCMIRSADWLLCNVSEMQFST